MAAVTARVSSRLADREYSTNEQTFSIDQGASREQVEEMVKLAKLVSVVADETFATVPVDKADASELAQAKGENKILLRHCAELQRENQYKTLYLSKLKEHVGEEKFKEISKQVEGSHDWLSVGTHSKAE